MLCLVPRQFVWCANTAVNLKQSVRVYTHTRDLSRAAGRVLQQLLVVWRASLWRTTAAGAHQQSPPGPGFEGWIETSEQGDRIRIRNLLECPVHPGHCCNFHKPGRCSIGCECGLLVYDGPVLGRTEVGTHLGTSMSSASQTYHQPAIRPVKSKLSCDVTRPIRSGAWPTHLIYHYI